MTERRILLADTDDRALAGLRASLPGSGDWDVSFAASSDAALEMLAAAPVDVLIADVRMPGLDGRTLLETARDQYPRVARVALSARTDRDSVAQAVAIAQLFINKAVPPSPALRSQILRICDLQARLACPPLDDVIGRMGKLPSTPSIYLELTKAIARPDVGLAEIADIVDCDPAIAAKVLQLVNSAFFGLAMPITSVHQAVLYLGSDLLKSVALTAHVFSKEQIAGLEGFSMPRLQEQALLCAQLANRLVDDQGVGDDAYAAGLLHDLGRVALAAGMPKAFAESIRAARFKKVPVHLVEQEVLGVTHADVGAYLLGKWGLPFAIVEAVAFQHHPAAVGPGPKPVLAATHLAGALVDAAFAREDEARMLARLEMPFLKDAGLDADISTWYSLACEQVAPVGRKRSLS